MTPAPKRPQPRRALRTLTPARIITPAPGVSIKTRLRLSPTDEIALQAVGAHLGRLTNQDLKRAQERTHTVWQNVKSCSPYIPPHAGRDQSSGRTRHSWHLRIVTSGAMLITYTRPSQLLPRALLCLRRAAATHLALNARARPRVSRSCAHAWLAYKRAWPQGAPRSAAVAVSL